MSLENINAQQLKSWLEAGEAILVDVREPDEFFEWRIPLATSMPLTNITQHLPNLEGEKRKVVFQCLKGKRGEMGANAAIQMFGDKLDIYNLEGGIEAWDSAGFTVLKDQCEDGSSCSAVLPITRQVFMAAGTLIGLFSVLAILGFSFAPYVTLLIGVGLLFAGLTGWCGMAKLLEKMPWNK